MKTKYLPLLILLFIGLNTFAQDDRILITEKKQGKRIVFNAKNVTEDTLNVFFMVRSEGYRRSADRPTIKFINPNETIQLITLIELANTPSSYEYTLVVNDEDYTLDLTNEKKTIDIERQISNRIVLFTDESCERCQLLHTELDVNKITHQVFDINKDPALYKQFIAFINKRFPDQQAMRLPAIWNKNELLFGWDQLDEIITKLKG